MRATRSVAAIRAALVVATPIAFVASGLISSTTITAPALRSELARALTAAAGRAATIGKFEYPAPLAASASTVELTTPRAATTGQLQPAAPLALVTRPGHVMHADTSNSVIERIGLVAVVASEVEIAIPRASFTNAQQLFGHELKESHVSLLP